MDISVAQSQETIFYNKQITQIEDKIAQRLLRFMKKYVNEEQDKIRGEELVNKNDAE